MSASSCTCSTPRVSGGTAKVENARETLLNPLPAGVTLEENRDVFCKWSGYKMCCGKAVEKSHIKSNFVTDNVPNKNVHFKGNDDNSGNYIKACRASGVEHATKQVTCYYNDAPTTPITGLSGITMLVYQPTGCGFADIGLTNTDMEVASEKLNEYYIDKSASVETTAH